jgi:hypothetical protein
VQQELKPQKWNLEYSMKNDKVIICLYGTSKTGKTSTIGLIPNEINKNFKVVNSSIQKQGNETHGTITLSNKKVIGIVSIGDPGGDQYELLPIIVPQCDLVICASRNYGDTVVFVDKIAKKNGFKVVWVRNYQSGNYPDTMMNQYSAEDIMQLLKRII